MLSQHISHCIIFFSDGAFLSEPGPVPGFLQDCGVQCVLIIDSFRKKEKSKPLVRLVESVRKIGS